MQIWRYHLTPITPRSLKKTSLSSVVRNHFFFLCAAFYVPKLMWRLQLWSQILTMHVSLKFHHYQVPHRLAWAVMLLLILQSPSTYNSSCADTLPCHDEQLWRIFSSCLLLPLCLQVFVVVMLQFLYVHIMRQKIMSISVCDKMSLC